MIHKFSARARFLCIIDRGALGGGGGGQEASEIQIPQISWPLPARTSFTLLKPI